MKLRISIFLFAFPSILFGQNKTKTEVFYHIGVKFEITLIADSDSLLELGFSAAQEEIVRIDSLTSNKIQGSEISLVNANAGICPVKVSRETFELLYRCQKVSELTDGAFDITWAPLGKLWKLNDPDFKLPAKSKIDSILPLIGYRNVVLNRDDGTVFLKLKGMKIGIGGVGEGYAANRALARLKSLGINNGIIIAGGDVLTWGKQANGKKWNIGIADPGHKGNVIAWVNTENISIITSGNYEQFKVIDGKTYTHILNPLTGYPADGMKSLTLFCPDAELADALATGLFVMDIEKAMSIVNQMKGIECLIITNENKIITSEGLVLNYYELDRKINNNNFTIGKTGQ
jgi:thiamine biosynthesis lipoprotein